MAKIKIDIKKADEETNMNFKEELKTNLVLKFLTYISHNIFANYNWFVVKIDKENRAIFSCNPKLFVKKLRISINNNK